MSAKTVAVGIDLGSYNSRVATFDDHSNHPVCAHNSDGNRTTRVVLPAEESGDGNGFSSNKNTVPVTAENLDRYITEKLMPLAYDAAHTKDLSVIVSIPNDERIPQEWLSALKQSGRGVITEAAAVCLAYDLEEKTENSKASKRILVVDGGASALKVALLQVTTSGLLCLESTQKTDTVHGEALVETLGQAVAQQFEIKHRFPRGEVWQSKKARGKLQRACENGLTTLQINNTLTIHVESLYEGIDCQVTISEAKWDYLSGKLVKNAKDFLNMTKAESSDIDTILLSGNMHAWLKPLVKEIFPGKLLSSGIDPSEAIAIGCTKQANWNLSHPDESISSTIPTTLDVPMSPIAIAIVQKENVVIEQGAPLPAFVKYELLSSEESSSEEETPTAAVEIWQVQPTEKHLATLSDLATNSTVCLLLTENKKLRIAVGGESIVIG
ncbi:unnamed protein product [Pseudo-nitzschia multistriata]|uniref:Uncharacterized protein n=1 Tax=Pseudo-nitzschia multistriata TaxID=183589 RepID=A0A448Z1Q7_9STRA|nr:unnamed protein product [Pseudo-nitzschia multistriata]